MIELNLPPYPYKVKQEKDKILIFDELRRRYVTLTRSEEHTSELQSLL